MAMIDKRRKSRTDVDYWRTMVDVVLGILLIVLMAMSLLMLGLMDRPLLEQSGATYKVEPTTIYIYNDDDDGSGGGVPTPTPEPTPTPIPIYDDDGGGGDGGGIWDWPSPVPTEAPLGEPDENDRIKSAVLVRLKDWETDRILPIPGIGFEVFDGDYRQLSYDVYYPEHIEYKRFETTKQGTFYLPDKLAPGRYTLQNINAPEDYDLMPDVSFEVLKSRDWDDPILVDAYMVPCTSVIVLETVDAETGEAVPGGLYAVVPPTDVITSGGTVRYKAGETVQNLSCDLTGRAQTNPLYLGTFELYQREIPFGYARADMGSPITLYKTPSEYTVSIAMEKTTLQLTVRDELTLARVPEIPFVLTGDNGNTLDIEADGNGEIRLANLEKDITYSFSMKESVNGYRMNDNVYAFYVDADGRIEGDVLYSMEVDVRKIRCTFGVVSSFFSEPIIGHDMALFHTDGTVIDQWISTEAPRLVEGLEPGTYVLTMDGKEMRLNVKDVKEQQSFRFRVWLFEDIAAASLTGLVVVGILAAVWLAWRKRKRASK